MSCTERSRAHILYANTACDTYVRLPAEDQKSNKRDVSGKFSKTMKVARDVAQNWQRKCSGTIQELGFAIGKASPIHLYHPNWDVCGLVHGDDFVFVLSNSHLATIGK